MRKLFKMKILIVTFMAFLLCDSNAANIELPNSLQLILLENDTIEDFSMNKKNYTVNLPYTTTKVPKIKAIGVKLEFKIKVFPASNLHGTLCQRTTKITVKFDKNLTADTIRIIFKVLPKLDLYLLIGQSNMAGRGKITSEFTDTLKNTYLLTTKGNMEAAFNPLNKHSNIRKELNLQQVGPGYGFSKTIVEKTGANIGLIVNARGGSSINSWVKGSSDGYYEKTLERLKDISKWGEIKAILWHQGEADSKYPDSYRQKLTNLVQNLRTDLNSPQLLFVAGELAYWRGSNKASTAFNDMIRTISDFIPNSASVSAEGLTPLKDFTDPHFDAKSQLVLGNRYALKVLEKSK